MKNIISVGISIPSTEVEYHEFNERISLSDADIIIFSPIIDMLYSIDSTYGMFQGKNNYNKNSSFCMVEDMHHWKNELNIALASGKTVFIILSYKNDFYISTGDVKYETGKRIVNNVMIYDNYKFLPIDVKIHSVRGQTMICQSSMFRSFYNDFKERLSYEVTIESSMIKEYSFTTKSKDRCLGTYLPVFNGHIVFIPMLYHDDDVFWKKDGTPSQKGEYFGKQLLSHIVEIDKVLTCNAEKTPKPMWLNHTDYVLKDVALTNYSINSNLQKIKN